MMKTLICSIRHPPHVSPSHVTRQPSAVSQSHPSAGAGSEQAWWRYAAYRFVLYRSTGRQGTLKQQGRQGTLKHGPAGNTEARAGREH